MFVDLTKLSDNEITIGDFTFNKSLPLEWQVSELAAEIACEECDLDNDCRKCEYYEYSLLYAIQNSSVCPDRATLATKDAKRPAML